MPDDAKTWKLEKATEYYSNKSTRVAINEYCDTLDHLRINLIQQFVHSFQINRPRL